MLAVDNRAMTPPRQIHPGQLRFVTVRAVNRCHRFAPSRQAVEIIWYCLAYTLSEFRGRIEAHEFLWMSNHYHLVLTDRSGCLPDFMMQLNSLLARALNALRGHTGTAIEKGYNSVEVTTEDKLIDHCVYTLANPCSAHLVKRSRHWKSVSSCEFGYGDAVTVRRPNCGLWGGACSHRAREASQESKRSRHGGRSKLPPTVELVLTRPSLMTSLSDDELRADIRARLDDRERELMGERRRRRSTVSGWRAATRVSPRSAPRQTEDRVGTVPRFSGGTPEALAAAWQRHRDFLASYYAAMRRFVKGERTAEFPVGTWLMKRRFGVAGCAVSAI
ncbi:MAG: hypothetical protein AB1Z98_31205 [Nannocystaceae bacterium]